MFWSLINVVFFDWFFFNILLKFVFYEKWNLKLFIIIEIIDLEKLYYIYI